MSKTEALRLAVLGSFRGGLTLGEVQEAEDELNRLVAQRDALLEALKAVEPILTRMYGLQAAELPPMQIVRAAIKAVEEKE